MSTFVTTTLAPTQLPLAGEIELDIDEGPVDTEVEITGNSFASDEEIEIEFDGDEIDIEDGDEDTDDDGEFTSYIFIPESIAGAHTIKVIVGGSEIEADFTVEPEITLDPKSGEADTTVTVSGTGFGRRQEVTIYFSDVGVAYKQTSREGSFNTTFTVPLGLGAGIYNVDAEDEDDNADRAKFNITFTPKPSPEPEPTPTPGPEPAPSPSPTAVSISQTTGQVGIDLLISGSGFEAGGTVTVKYDNEEVATATAGGTGIFVAAFKIPASKYGDHAITISDGTNTDEITFTMESTPPPVAAPLLPEMGVEVKPPLSFDWKDVTDDSLPVAYNLQIATSQDFSDASIVLEKKGLTESKYTVTAAEEEKLVAGETPYYWRVRAIDGASNEGDWTGAGQFYVAAVFALPSWALYTLIGLGGLLLFAIGYWFGRRTAFYY